MDPENQEQQSEDSSSGSGAVGTGNDDRLARLSEIADAHEREVEDQFANVNDDDTTEPFVAPKAESDESDTEDKPDVVAKTEEISGPDTEDKEVAKHKIVVNGKELELTTEELIARAQKVEAADEYLRKAKQSVAPTRTGPTDEQVKAQQDKEDLALARALQVGTEEEALAAVRKIREQASARPSISQDDVARTIDERLVFKDAIKAFRSEYKEIAEDPILWKMALSKDDELLQAGDARSYAERYTEIGDEIRSWMKAKMPAPAPADEDVKLEEKKAKKAAAPSAPKPASKKTAPPEAEDDGPETPSEVIAGIAKQRGGPQWMRS